ncbi:hypothetical protein [Brevibacillus laterosporus]|uniref:hypothetical protein n=1 Tax=Brevibacillus laterosporus TaxID=1465 RepID=UPI0026569884|nr:hypothetical protein [Brevibacillus laterosporus]MDN9012657.1 hypothetical protein [Brevibacillus laterosporus]MDO0943720.1 hypothetical protein [Brevibacillus laterosporus]
MQKKKRNLLTAKAADAHEFILGLPDGYKPSSEGIRYVYQEDNGKESPLHVFIIKSSYRFI